MHLKPRDSDEEELLKWIKALLGRIIWLMSVSSIGLLITGIVLTITSDWHVWIACWILVIANVVILLWWKLPSSSLGQDTAHLALCAAVGATTTMCVGSLVCLWATVLLFYHEAWYVALISAIIAGVCARVAMLTWPGLHVAYKTLTSTS